MTRTLKILLATRGDPKQLSGGYLYHRRLAELAPENGCSLEFASLPAGLPVATIRARSVLNDARAKRHDALVIDSIAAAAFAPFVRTRSELTRVGSVHQPPGGIDHGRIRTPVQARLDALVYRHLDHILVASEALALDLAAWQIPPGRISVVRPGRDPSSEPGKRVELRRGRQAAVLCVANWLPRKGIDALLEAVARLPASTVTLHLVGDDTADERYAARLRARLAQEDLVGRVETHGVISRAEIATMYRSADAFALTSLKEPYGTVYGEAMAVGLPVVGWRLGNLPHLADDGIEGFVLEPGSIEALSSALLRLAQEPELRRRLGESARRRAVSFPTWPESARLFFTAIRAVVEERGTRSQPA